MAVGKQVKGKVEEAVFSELKVLARETDEAIGLATKGIYRRFDALEKMILGEEDDGHPSLMEMLELLEPILPLIRAIITDKLNVKDIDIRFSEHKPKTIVPPSLSFPIIPAGGDRFA